MSNEFIQRQITGTVGIGDYTTMAQFDPSKNVWSLNDVRPTTIMKIDPGKHSSGVLTIPATTGTATVPLPESYDTANRLAVFIFSNTIIKCVTVSPAHSTSSVLIKPSAASNANSSNEQRGILNWIGRVTSITLSNVQSVAATVQYMMWEYPTDISASTTWRSGAQTTGVITSA